MAAEANKKRIKIALGCTAVGVILGVAAVIDPSMILRETTVRTVVNISGVGVDGFDGFDGTAVTFNKLTTGIFSYKEETCHTLEKRVLDEDGNEEKLFRFKCLPPDESEPLECRHLRDPVRIAALFGETDLAKEDAGKVEATGPFDFQLSAMNRGGLTTFNDCDQERTRRCQAQQGFSVLSLLVSALAAATMLIFSDSSRALAHSSRMYVCVAFFLLVVWSIGAHEASTEESAKADPCGRQLNEQDLQLEIPAAFKLRILDQFRVAENKGEIEVQLNAPDAFTVTVEKNDITVGAAWALFVVFWLFAVVAAVQMCRASKSAERGSDYSKGKDAYAVS